MLQGLVVLIFLFCLLQNQFFISVMDNNAVKNGLADALFDRIIQAHKWVDAHFRSFYFLPGLKTWNLIMFCGEIKTCHICFSQQSWRNVPRLRDHATSARIRRSSRNVDGDIYPGCYTLELYVYSPRWDFIAGEAGTNRYCRHPLLWPPLLNILYEHI